MLSVDLTGGCTDGERKSEGTIKKVLDEDLWLRQVMSLSLEG